MRTLVSPDFSEQLTGASFETLAHVKEALSVIEQGSKEEIVNDPSVVPLTIGQELFALKAGGSRIFFSFGSDNQGEYALVIGLAVRESSASLAVSSSRKLHPSPDPKRDSDLNPIFNSNINPKRNSKINPKFNSSINPRFSATLNPKFNSRINPKFTASINPKFNSKINPKFNSSLNPKFNWSINPTSNKALRTQFVYDLQANAIGFTVIADNEIRLIFDGQGVWTNYAIPNEKGGFVVFKPDAEWVEHWVSNGASGWNRFNLENEWIGFVM